MRCRRRPWSVAAAVRADTTLGGVGSCSSGDAAAAPMQNPLEPKPWTFLLARSCPQRPVECRPAAVCRAWQPTAWGCWQEFVLARPAVQPLHSVALQQRLREAGWRWQPEARHSGWLSFGQLVIRTWPDAFFAELFLFRSWIPVRETAMPALYPERRWRLFNGRISWLGGQSLLQARPWLSVDGWLSVPAVEACRPRSVSGWTSFADFSWGVSAALRGCSY